MAQLVVCLPGRHEVVGSNPCCCVTFLAENIPVLSGRLVCNYRVKDAWKFRKRLKVLKELSSIRFEHCYSAWQSFNLASFLGSKRTNQKGELNDW